MKLIHKILNLKPTQFAVGMLEVDEKIKTVKDYSKEELDEYVRDNPVPVIISPRGEIYVTDKHHFLCVCYHLGLEEVHIKIVEDLRGKKMTFAQFWKRMDRGNSVYPYCQFGEGPREPIYLPRDIRGLADDPYRSLAWFVRKAGAFENSEKNFAEFQWANFFRSKKLLKSSGNWDFARAIIRATRLAQSSAAKHLPGYGKLNLEEKKKVRKKLRKQVSKSLRA